MTKKIVLWGVALVVALGLAPAALAETGGDAGMIVSGSRKGNGDGIVRVRVDLDSNANYETLAASFNPYPGSKVSDGVRVATGDLSGDSNEELVTSAGNGLPVKIFELNSDGTVGSLIESLKVFGARGVFVAAGDVDGFGRAELIVAAGSGTPNVKIYSDVDSDGRVFDGQVDSFFAFPTGFTGGVRVAAGNTSNSGGAEVITASASAGRRVKVWSDSDFDRAVSDNPLLEDASVFSSSFKGGVNVAAGEIGSVGGGGAELTIAPATGKGKVFIRTDTDADGDVFDNPAFESFYPYGSGWNRGIRLAAGDTDHSGFFVEILTAPGALAGSKKVRIYDDSGDVGVLLHDNPVTQEFKAMPSSVKGGAYVAVGRVFGGAYMSLETPRPIPDLGSTTSDTFVPASAGRVRGLTVYLNIPHTFAEDLDVTLTHMASGTSVVLFTDVGSDANGFLISLNDDNGNDIGAVVAGSTDASIVGPFNPEGAALLSAFNGLDASGAWRLMVTDDAGLDTGQILSWGLSITY
jgi:Proprotein convertase P-domain